MNDMLSMKFKQVAAYCTVHKIQKIQAGPNQICPECAKKLVEESNKNHQEKVDQRVRELHFAGAMIPHRHMHSGFRNYTTELPGQNFALKSCISFSKAMIEGEKRNLILSGKTGTGKTHLGCATARTLLNKGLFVRYITSEDMANEIANAWKKADDSEAAAIYRFTDTDLLILDEYGLHDRHENRLQLVHKVLYSRYDEAKPTMLISNLTVQKLKEDLGDRLWSRFQHEGLNIVECNWQDARIKSCVVDQFGG